MKRKRTLALILALTAVCAVFLTACQSDKDKPNNETSTSAAASDADLTAVSSAEAAATASATDEEQNNNSSNSGSSHYVNRPDSGSDANSGANSGANADSSDQAVSDDVNGPVSNATHCTITVGNKGYKTELGDTVTYTYYLETPKMIENVQAQTTYTSSLLKLKSTEKDNLFPVLGSSTVFNLHSDVSTIKFNASNISGYDFTQKGVLITLKFEVVGKGGASIATAIEIMDEIGGEPYIDHFLTKGDIKCEELLKVS
ncbi:MAG: hypothetical protein ACI4GZ_06400 [Ruminococcus sp.]